MGRDFAAAAASEDSLEHIVKLCYASWLESGHYHRPEYLAGLPRNPKTVAVPLIVFRKQASSHGDIPSGLDQKQPDRAFPAGHEFRIQPCGVWNALPGEKLVHARPHSFKRKRAIGSRDDSLAWL